MLPFRSRVGAFGCALRVALVASFLPVPVWAEAVSKSVSADDLEQGRWPLALAGTAPLAAGAGAVFPVLCSEAFSASGLASLGRGLWLEPEPVEARGGGLGWQATATADKWQMGVGGRF